MSVTSSGPPADAESMSDRRAKMAAAIAAAIVLVGIALYAGTLGFPETVLQLGPPASSASPTATSTVPASPTVTPSSVATAAAAVRPDAQHGLVTFTNIRTEADPRDLQQPPAFARRQVNTFNIAVAPEGKRVALIRTGQTGQQLISFTTASPNDVTTLVDFSGGGEFATYLVWAGDGTGSLLMVVEKHSRGPGGGDNLIIEYSALRSVDVATREVKEIARISGESRNFFPLAWLPGKQLAAALEVRTLGPVANYVLVRNGTLERTDLKTGASVSSFTASRDGHRIAGAIDTGVRWWPIDEPLKARVIPGTAGEMPWNIAFRPGMDELGVQVGSGPGGAVPARFEIWSLTGQRRVVSATTGFERWRVDGSGALAGTALIDPATGAVTQLPGGPFMIAAAVLF